MQVTTLLFPVKRKESKITEICLAMKKRGFGAGRWNGAGGKLLDGESVHDAVLRETKEEFNIEVKDLNKIAELKFHFDQKPEWNQVCHVFFVESWDVEPTESEEMRPEWFEANKIPFENMWPDDIYWLPLAIEDKTLKAEFVFGEGDVVLNKKIELVSFTQ